MTSACDSHAWDPRSDASRSAPRLVQTLELFRGIYSLLFLNHIFERNYQIPLNEMAVVAHGVRTLGVLGSGQMGASNMPIPPASGTHALLLYVGLGIAYVSALRAKVPVLLHDRSSVQIQKGLELMDKLLEKDVAKACLLRQADFTYRLTPAVNRERSRLRRLRKLVIVSQ